MRLASLLEEPGVEEVLSLAGPVGFLALHGGGQDRVTDQIASEAAALYAKPMLMGVFSR